MISCPACNAAISVKQLFWTGTLLRFKCPHCATKVQPTANAFAIPWLVIAAAVGGFAGAAAPAISGFANDAARGLAYAGLAIAVVGTVALIKWRASLALIRKGELKVAK